MIPKYRIRCIGGGEIVEDLTRLACPAGHNSLLRTEYSARNLRLAPYEGMYRYIDWLPVSRPLLPSGGPVTFTCEDLSRDLGLGNLWISFSGYFPERSAQMTTGSFKELEASPTMERLHELGGKIPVIASAGNTGRAFAELSARCKRPVILSIPEKAASRIWTTQPASDIFLVTVAGDYSDAIDVSNVLASVPGCSPEGGAKNVARRDGMGTVMLDAAVTLGRIPDHYFQAIGSGTGGIAVYEAFQRLVADGRYGKGPLTLHLAQNEPFVPMASAWRNRRREIIPEVDMPNASESIGNVIADVLTNRNPPYGIAGGVYDVLVASQGEAYTVRNEDARDADKHIRETIGIDPDPAAAVALAALIQAAQTNKVGADDYILLNITGGGYERIREDFTLHPVAPSVHYKPGTSHEEITRELKAWIDTYG